MSSFLITNLGNFLSMLIVFSVSSLNLDIGYNTLVKEQNLSNENTTVVSSVINYETIYSYDSSIPSNITKTLVYGENGVSFIDVMGNTNVLLDPVSEQIVVGTGKIGNYTGIMTGYGPDCSTCDGRGYTACNTSDLGWYNILEHGVYYDDSIFGDARVLAADLSEFPCGTIVEVVSSNAGTFTGIVLDTGYDMRKNFANGIIHFDVAYMTEDDPELPKITNKTGVSYNVQRWGW